MKKINMNVLVAENVNKEFNNWEEALPGDKGDKMTGALKAIQALHEIDSGLAFGLMKPTVPISEAVRLIRKAITNSETLRFLDSLSPEQKTLILVAAKEAEEKILKKK
jgi:hypothetical protein